MTNSRSQTNAGRIRKIVFLTFEFYPKSAGVANATLSLARALDAKGVDVLVVAPRENPDWKAREDLSERIHVLRIRKLVKVRSPINRAYLIVRALIAIRKYQPDAIVGQMLNWGGAIAALAGKLTGRLSVGYAHASWDTEGCFGRVNRWLRQFCLRHCDLIVATNTFHGRALDVVEPGVREKSYVVPNAAAFSHFSMSREEARRKLGFPSGGFDLVSVGRLVPSKGITYAIEAMRRLPNDTRLHILGDGDLREELSRQINDGGVSSRVILYGAMDRETVFTFMKAADALVFPALFEGFSMTSLEAMHLGTPVISTSVGGLGDMMEDGKTGLVVRCADPEEIARAVTDLRSDPELRQRITEQARELVNTKFSGDAVAEEFLTILGAYVEDRGRNRANH